MPTSKIAIPCITRATSRRKIMNQALLLLLDLQLLIASASNFNPLPICHQVLETPDVFQSVVFIIKRSWRLCSLLLGTLLGTPAMATRCLCLVGMLNIVAWSFLLLGWIPPPCKSISSWGSRGGATLPFSWCIFCWPQHPLNCGKRHEEGSDSPNQTVTSSAGAPGAGARSQPFLRKWRRWSFTELGKKIELPAFVAVGEKWVPVSAPGTLNDLQPKAVQEH